MASDNTIEQLRSNIDTVLGLEEPKPWDSVIWEYEKPETIWRPLSGAFTIVRLVKDSDLDRLPIPAVNALNNSIKNLLSALSSVVSFKPSHRNPNQEASGLINRLSNEINNLYKDCNPSLTALLHFSGKADENVNTVVSQRDRMTRLLDKTEKTCEASLSEIQSAVQSAKAAAAKTGAAAFTRSFRAQAKLLERSATIWLRSTMILAVLAGLASFSLAFGLTFPVPDWLSWLFRISSPTGSIGAVQTTVSKLAFLGLFIGAAAWCGKNYRAVKHQAADSRHRGLSIQTLQAFREATVDDHVKDLVVAEAARAVFANVSTGLVNAGNADAARPVEIPRAVVSLAPPSGN